MKHTKTLRIAAVASSICLAAVYVGYRVGSADAGREPAPRPAPEATPVLRPSTRTAPPQETDFHMRSSKSAAVFGDKDIPRLLYGDPDAKTEPPKPPEGASK